LGSVMEEGNCIIVSLMRDLQLLQMSICFPGTSFPYIDIVYVGKKLTLGLMNHQKEVAVGLFFYESIVRTMLHLNYINFAASLSLLSLNFGLDLDLCTHAITVTPVKALNISGAHRKKNIATRLTGGFKKIQILKKDG
ncbi:hypothetical protein ACJX0J_032318, partial [Zea mays]